MDRQAQRNPCRVPCPSLHNRASIRAVGKIRIQSSSDPSKGHTQPAVRGLRIPGLSYLQRKVPAGFGESLRLHPDLDGRVMNSLCTATTAFYVLILLSIVLGATAWVTLQKYAAAVAKECGLEKDFFYAKAADESGASVFEVQMLKEVMSKKYLSRSERLISLGVKARFAMLIAVGSVFAAVITAGVRHVICGP